MEGWIKLHRKIAQWQWASSPNHMTLFMQLLLRANHKPSKWRTETIEAGQILTGRKQLMDWTGLSEKQVRKCLDDLESTKEIVRKRSAKYSIISIANWKTYQSEGREKTVQGPAEGQQTATSKNDNNINNEKNIIIKPSPLSFLFDQMPAVQDWLNNGSHDTHALLVTKFSHHVLAEEIPKMFAWASKKDVRAENWMYPKLLNVDTQAYTANSAKKSFSTQHTIQSLTSEEIELLKAAGQL